VLYCISFCFGQMPLQGTHQCCVLTNLSLLCVGGCGVVATQRGHARVGSGASIPSDHVKCVCTRLLRSRNKIRCNASSSFGADHARASLHYKYGHFDVTCCWCWATLDFYAIVRQNVLLIHRVGVPISVRTQYKTPSTTRLCIQLPSNIENIVDCTAYGVNCSHTLQ
jgi:hypothetical protein